MDIFIQALNLYLIGFTIAYHIYHHDSIPYPQMLSDAKDNIHFWHSGLPVPCHHIFTVDGQNWLGIDAEMLVEWWDDQGVQLLSQTLPTIFAAKRSSHCRWAIFCVGHFCCPNIDLHIFIWRSADEGSQTRIAMVIQIPNPWPPTSGYYQI